MFNSDRPQPNPFPRKFKNYQNHMVKLQKQYLNKHPSLKKIIPEPELLCQMSGSALAAEM